MRKIIIFTLGSLTALALNSCSVAIPENRANGQMNNMDHGAMTADPTTSFDAQFIDSMIEHHQGAIEMAQQALEQTERLELRQLSEEIIAAQTQEIEQLTTWRTEWHPDLPLTSGMAMDMGDMEISAEQNKPFDQRFLEAMISHHQGAIDMAQMAQRMAEREEIRTLAGAIISAQQAEIVQMQAWLAEWFGVETERSPYVAQLDSPVRGLSEQEVEDLLAGRGMAYARTAELNSHPGPRHLLDLQKELSLSGAQVDEIEAIFAEMQMLAQALGNQIVTQEQKLSTAFANGAIDPATLEAQVMALTELYGRLRLTHLTAHLQVASLLTTEQIMVYDQLRGYTDGIEPAHLHNLHH